MTKTAQNVTDAVVPCLNNTSIELATIIVNACSDARAKEPVVLNVKPISDIADNFIIVSGRSDRHVQGITNKIIAALEPLGLAPESVEGFDKAHWVLIDLGEIVVHVFYEPIREYYDLEGLWARATKVPMPEMDERQAA
jgi:ribosome-associated protein